LKAYKGHYEAGHIGIFMLRIEDLRLYLFKISVENIIFEELKD